MNQKSISTRKAKLTLHRTAGLITNDVNYITQFDLDNNLLNNNELFKIQKNLTDLVVMFLIKGYETGFPVTHEKVKEDLDTLTKVINKLDPKALSNHDLLYYVTSDYRFMELLGIIVDNVRRGISNIISINLGDKTDPLTKQYDDLVNEVLTEFDIMYSPDAFNTNTDLGGIKIIGILKSLILLNVRVKEKYYQGYLGSSEMMYVDKEKWDSYVSFQTDNESYLKIISGIERLAILNRKINQSH